MVRVKICGVTRPEDVRLIVREGGDAIGFQMSRGPRKIDPGHAKRLVRLVPPFVTPVGVFVDEPLAKVKALIKYCGFQAAQLHGSENAAYCEALGWPVLKAVRMKNARSAGASRDFRVAAFLLDHYNKHVKGGTGQSFDWKWVPQAAALLPAPVILAGGLTPDNVARAIRAARPFGVDVASGVESRPGLKDPRKVSQFIRNAKKAVRG